MKYMARWGPKGFLVSPDKIVPFEDFSTSLTLKEDSENDTSGTPPTNTRGRELRPITFSTKYLRAAGVDPRRQLEDWEAQLGKAYPLYIGEKQFGPPKMKLKKVEGKGLQIAPSGEWLSIEVSITLEEYSEGKTSALTGKSAPNAAAANKAAGVYAATVAEKKAALEASASKTDKQQKKPTAKKGGAR